MFFTKAVQTTLAKIIGGKMHEIILIIFWREK